MGTLIWLLTLELSTLNRNIILQTVWLDLVVRRRFDTPGAENPVREMWELFTGHVVIVHWLYH